MCVCVCVAACLFDVVRGQVPLSFQCFPVSCLDVLARRFHKHTHFLSLQDPLPVPPGPCLLLSCQSQPQDHQRAGFIVFLFLSLSRDRAHVCTKGFQNKSVNLDRRRGVRVVLPDGRTGKANYMVGPLVLSHKMCGFVAPELVFPRFLSLYFFTFFFFSIFSIK